ncbi:MAG: hypothetical protein FJ118_09375 [Deltaproteobacteria bacterium]|nr:hypothetical protein [Deltaproteobacteria bacterium]
MERKGFAKEFKRLTEHFHHQASTLEAEEYYRALVNIPADEFRVVVTALIDRCEFWPKIPVFRATWRSLFPGLQTADLGVSVESPPDLKGFAGLSDEEQEEFRRKADKKWRETSPTGYLWTKEVSTSSFNRLIRVLAASLREDSLKGASDGKKA